MSPEQLERLKELSELFSKGDAEVSQVKQLTEVLDKINNKTPSVVDYNQELTTEES